MNEQKEFDVNVFLREKYLTTLNNKQKRIEGLYLDKKCKLLDRLIKEGIITTVGREDYFYTLHNLEDRFDKIPDEFIQYI